MTESVDVASSVHLDLLYLAQERDGRAQLELLQGREHLARAVFGLLELPMPNSLDARSRLLLDVLSHVASNARSDALAQMRNVKRWKDRPEFQTAAAAELLELTDRDALDEIVPQYSNDKAKSSLDLEDHKAKTRAMIEGRAEKTADRTPRRQAQARAAVWMGLGDRSIRNKEDALLKVFESAMAAHISANREELVELLGAGVETKARNPSEHVVDYQSEPTAEPSTRSRGSRPVDPKLRDALFELADRVYSDLRAQHRRLGISSEADLIPVRWSEVDVRRGARGLETSELPPQSGRVRDVANLYENIPSGRLVIVGEGGSGKSVLVRELALELLKRRSPGDPVPVVFSLASWNPGRQTLRRWVAKQIVENYPLPRRKMRRHHLDIAFRLVEAGLVIPFLDGFDEIDREILLPALDAIRGSLNPEDGIVLASRPEELGRSGRLDRARSLVLRELVPDNLASYLSGRTDEENERSSSSWDSVLTRLQDNPMGSEERVLREVLRRPLTVSIARSYVSDPESLLDSSRFPDAISLTDHLFDRYLDRSTILARESIYGSDWPRELLGFLAISMFSERSFPDIPLHPERTSPTLILLHIPAFILLFAPLATVLAYSGVNDEDSEAVLAVASTTVAFLIAIVMLPYFPRGVQPRILPLLFLRGLGEALCIIGFVGIMVIALGGVIITAMFRFGSISYEELLRFFYVDLQEILISEEMLVISILATFGAFVASRNGSLFVRLFELHASFPPSPRSIVRWFGHVRKCGILRLSGRVYEFRHAELQEFLAKEFARENTGRWALHRATVSAANPNLVAASLARGRLSGDEADVIQSIVTAGTWWRYDETVWPRWMAAQRAQMYEKTAWSGLIEVVREGGQLDEVVARCRKSRRGIRVSRGWILSVRYFDQRLALADLLIEQHDIEGAFVEIMELDAQLKRRKLILRIAGSMMSRDTRVTASNPLGVEMRLKALLEKARLASSVHN
ncbi:NACHT domain-containing protein [Myceligenerans halotolerans]